jgi:hypothetical protein
MQNIELILFGVFAGFAAYAVLLLFPVYRFLQREEQLADDLSREELEHQLEQMKQSSASNTSTSKTDPPV